MMPRNPENERVTATFRCPPALLDRLTTEADKRVMGRSKLIELLLERGLAALSPVLEDATPTPQGET